MNHHLGAKTLPVELLSLVFDSLSLQELLSASHVAKFWRDVALRHPTFWRDVSLSSLSAAALDCFRARLDAGLSRSVIVRIRLQEVGAPARLPSVALQAVTRNLFRIDMLFVKIGLSSDADLFAALKGPAPRLNSFDMVVAHEGRTSNALPADLFASHAPNLRFVRLINTEILANRLPPAFSSITHLRYCSEATQSFPTALFAHCRLLRSLAIYGPCCSFVPDDKPMMDIPSRGLASVDVSVFSGGFDIMRHLPCASISDMSTTLHDEESAALLLAHLQGRLDVHIYHARRRLFVQYKSPRTGMQRAFACLPKLTAESCLPPVYISDDLVSRIDAIHCSAKYVALLPLFERLPSCNRVVLSHAEDWPTNLPPRPLAVPALERVDISSAAAAQISASDLVAFLDRTLDPVARKVEVALSGVVLDGDLAVLGERFKVSHTS